MKTAVGILAVVAVVGLGYLAYKKYVKKQPVSVNDIIPEVKTPVSLADSRRDVKSISEENKKATGGRSYNSEGFYN
jgi:uncharacterized membrane protein YebE (DUF533 family)